LGIAAQDAVMQKLGANIGIGTLEVERDLSGGVRIKLGSFSCVLSPAQACKYGAAVLMAAGVEVKVDNPKQQILAPTRKIMSG
jgi:hypothetical protein